MQIEGLLGAKEKDKVLKRTSSVENSHILHIFLLILLFFLGCLNIMECLPLGSEGVCLSNVICDDDVVKNGLCLHLPQVKANETKICILVHSIVIHKLWIVDFLGFPDTLVLRVR